MNTFILPGHAFLTHVSFCEVEPVQFFPPPDGFGLSQVLALVCVPLPHVKEQDVHFSQPLHFPLTTCKHTPTCDYITW